MVEHIEVDIEDLLLDEENPRIGSVQSQSEALESIIHLNESHCRNLMLSIKKNGLDPGDSLYVIDADSEDEFIVLEGNRRLSALLVMSNPDVLNGIEITEKTKNSLLRALSGFDRTKVEPIRCVHFDRREDANEWIERRHTGSADGAGRIQWGPLEIQRFSGDRSVLDVIDFVGRNADYSDEEWNTTKEMIESRKSSNLSRMLESAVGRKHLDISIVRKGGEKTPILGSDPKWALKVIQRIIEDVRDGVVDSRDLNKASDIREYFENLPQNLQPKTTKPENPRPFKDIQIKTRSRLSQGTAKKKQQSKAPRQSRRQLAPRRHPFKSPTSTRGENLLREASSLDADKFTLSAAFVLRAFVELSLNDYMTKNRISKTVKDSKGKTQELDLAKKAEKVVQDIRAKGTFSNADLRGFRNRLMTKTSSCSIQSLSGFVHNRFQIPTADELRAGWEASVPIFTATYGSV